jgi:3-oxoadipate enol-lactonase
VAEPRLSLTRIAGQPENPAVLIVGPSLGTSVQALWSRCGELLADRFDVYGWDLPGHGLSPSTEEPFGVGDLANAVRSLSADAAHARRTVYAGVSLGGAVGLELALDPGPFSAVAALGSAAQIGTPEGWKQRAELVRAQDTSALLSATPGRWFTDGFVERQPDVAQPLLNALAHADDESYALACDALADFDLTAELTKAKTPLLFGIGSEDPVITAKQVEAQVESVKDVHVVTVPNCSHLPPAERPVETAQALRSFFDEVTTA